MAHTGTEAVTKRRRSVTRERLLDAAKAVFAERGIAAASVEEICERAGFTRGAFYSNFAHKDDLILAVLDREESSILERLGQAVSQAIGAPEPLRVIGDRLFEIQPFGLDNYLLHAELGVLAVRDRSVAAPYLAWRQAFRERFVPFLTMSLAAAGRRLVVADDDAIDTLEALFGSSIRTSLVDGTDPNRPDSLARRMLPVLLAAMTEPLPATGR